MPSSVRSLPFTLIHGPNIPDSCATLFFTTSDFTSITSHIHNRVLFLHWLCLFILSGVISPLISSSILATYLTWGAHLSVSYLFVFSCCSWGSQRILKWFAFPSPVDHVLSELSTMTRLSWVALHDMAYSFIELDKAVVHVIRLVSFL